MGPTPWSAALDTGHPALDEQHRELFRRHAEALDSARRGDAEAARAALAGLLDRTREHFAFEEKLMAEAGYPQRELHGQAHSQCMEDLVALVGEGARDPCSAGLRLWLESRYASWWRWHVRSNDAPLARHLLAAGAPPREARPAAARTEP
jgi:hemerythrin-like metal-binding protein